MQGGGVETPPRGCVETPQRGGVETLTVRRKKSSRALLPSYHGFKSSCMFGDVLRTAVSSYTHMI